MPPRSYYISPRKDDYSAYLNAFGVREDVRIKGEEFFDEWGVPYIKGLNEIACYLSVETSTLYNMLRKKEKNYKCFTIEHFNGKIRDIESPRTYLKVVQWWILDNILSSHVHDECVHGFVRERSYFTNAKTHFGARHLLTLDVKNFFPSIGNPQVFGAFEKLGYSSAAAELLMEFCTLFRRLPQGAPTSPAISNMVFSKIDINLKEAAINAGLMYTRYADDLTFSGQSYIPKSFFNEVRALIADGGFKLNKEKTRFLGTGDRMEVTGLVINDKIQLPRKWRFRARAMFHQADKTPMDFIDRISELYGILNTLKQFEGDEKTKLIILGEKAVSKVVSFSQVQ